MLYQNIPAELKQLRQWVIWRTVPDNRTGVPRKIPYNPNYPILPAKINDPSTWSDYETAEEICMADKNFGLGFVFTSEDPYVGFDFDNRAKVKPEHLEERISVEQALLNGTGSYIEVSPSGTGLHMIVRAKLPGDSQNQKKLQIECYSALRFFTFTGQVINDRVEITDEQPAVDWWVSQYPKNDLSSYEDSPVVSSTEDGRRLDLSDDEVMQLAWDNIRGFQERWLGNISALSNDWSSEHRNLIGDFDKITGDPEQVRRLVQSSPLVLNTPPKGGITRLSKSQRLFFQLLVDVRSTLASVSEGYRYSPAMIANGREIWAAIEAERGRRHKEAVERLREQSERMSPDALEIRAHYTAIIGEQPLLLTRPPGLMGALVEACESATKHPFTKFAVPITFAVLSGIMGRRYKIFGSGLNMNFLLVADTGTGKSFHRMVWSNFLQQVEDQLAIESRSAGRLLTSSAGSIQGLTDELRECPSRAWAVDEAYTMLRMMLDDKQGKGPGSALRNSVTELFDASKHNAVFSPPLSRTSKANGGALRNVNVSTYWTMTPGDFKKLEGNLLDGFLSRLMIVYEDKEFGPTNHSWANYQLPGHLFDALSQVLSYAKALDNMYSDERTNAAGLLVHVGFDDDAAELYRQIDEITTDIKRRAVAGSLPKDFLILNRVDVMALKIAATMAALNAGYDPNPRITSEQLRWAIGYVLQNSLALVSHIQSGEVGAGASDEVSAIIRAYKEMVRKPEFRNKGGMPRNKFTEVLRRRAPFIGEHRTGKSASIRVSETLAHMLKEGMFAEETTTPEGGGRGRPVILLSPTDHEIWG